MPTKPIMIFYHIVEHFDRKGFVDTSKDIRKVITGAEAYALEKKHGISHSFPGVPECSLGVEPPRGTQVVTLTENKKIVESLSCRWEDISRYLDNAS